MAKKKGRSEQSAPENLPTEPAHNVIALKSIKKKEFTFANGFELLWKPRKRGQIASYYDECKRIEAYAIPVLGDMPVRKIKPMHVIELLNPLLKAGKLSTLKRVLMRINEILEFCILVGVLKINKCRKLQKLFPLPNTQNRPYINANQLEYLFIEALEKPPARTRIWWWPFLLTQVYSMLRPNEVVALRWDWIDPKTFKVTIPAEHMKKRREFTFYFHPELYRMVKKAYDKSGSKSPYLFPYGYGKPINKQYISKWLQRSSLRGKLCTHGLRATGRTFLKDVQCPYEIAEDCLSHLQGTATNRAYIRGDYYDQRVPYMCKWWNFIKRKILIAFDIKRQTTPRIVYNAGALIDEMRTWYTA